MSNLNVSKTNEDAAPKNLLEAAPLPSNSTVTSRPEVPSVSASAVLGESSSMPKGTPICRGYDFSQFQQQQQQQSSSSFDALDAIMKSMCTTGFQATNVALAIERINEMRAWRLSDQTWKEGDDEDLRPPSIRSKIRTRIFMSYTSNQISCGQREVLRFLVQHRMVDVIVTTAGGIEEDLIKTFEPTFMGDFHLKGRELRKSGINRIGNLLIPNSNYCRFEDWMAPLLHRMHDEQDQSYKEWMIQQSNQKDGGDSPLTPPKPWTPSKFIHRLGKEINDESSVLYWAYKHDIPIFCPALTDGSVGDMIYFHSYKRPGFLLDIAADIRGINDLAVQSHKTGQIILGGGLVKHHTCNANLMRNGADYSVFINTAQEFDGSDSGASPDEAVSWGKIRIDAKPVKVCADASIVFPLIVSQTFAKNVKEWEKNHVGTTCWID
eukprot:CAMPEP_0184863848 /NCGR_PEP_ID=MMETSP0580-20130426/12784_1 /TAXON_ID=1118495 /ORGANISM="Dactyliosolen fragilissimus" /LENGTH=435 /DNA_ID=CAMNT_0027362421 /DNA_START=138 /DNA_END=1445 /DNA_ORIENTATION=-